MSLSENDVAILDEFARAAGLATRSAAVQVAVRSLRLPQLEDDYATAWDDWKSSGEQADWDNSASDGLADASR